MTTILGISAFYHDSAACLLVDGKIVAAAQEERFTRKKHDSEFPLNAIQFCLREGGLVGADVDHVVFYEKPLPKFERLLETYLAYAPKGFRSFAMAMPVWLTEKLFQKRNLIKALEANVGADVDWSSKILFSEHHLSHAASAFYPSPFESAAVLTMDGVGEWPTTSLAIGSGSQLEIVKEIHFPHSLGLLYSAFTYYAGFKVNSGEYKVMGLAPYGNPVYAKLIFDNLVDLHEDGSFRLNMEYFDYPAGLTMTNKKFSKLFGGPPRKPESELTQREMDLAASIQAVTEEIVLRMCRAIAKETGQRNLCLAGGVALNCVANGKLLRDGSFDNIWIQPAAGDAGGALGAALAVHYLMLDEKRTVDAAGNDMQGSYLGTHYTQAEIEERLNALGAVFETVDDEKLINETASALASGKAVGWQTQKILNLKVKFRESFRPFAPSVLREHVSEWFDIDVDSPYMLLVADVDERKQEKMTPAQEALFGIEKLNVSRSSIPAVTHVDYSARIQTVHRETNPRYHALITKFNELTGCPVLVNTSFNVRGEPIVETPEDAFRCLMGTDLDLLAIGNAILYKSNQPISLIEDYKDKYELD